ncbi:MAG: hypothetical protein ACLFPV_07800 [Spirochaetaceae bacterium]
MELTKEFRDIPLWVAKDYIRVLPESLETAQGFSGPGWSIELTALPPVTLGELTFRRMRFQLSGKRESVEAVWRQLEHKFYRGGA